MSDFESTLTPQQQSQVKAWGGCHLDNFENADGTRTRSLGYEPHHEKPFIVVEFKKPTGREALHSPKDCLIRSDQRHFPDFDTARKFAEKA